jgi:hypothetical protein
MQPVGRGGDRGDFLFRKKAADDGISVAREVLNVIAFASAAAVKPARLREAHDSPPPLARIQEVFENASIF